MKMACRTFSEVRLFSCFVLLVLFISVNSSKLNVPRVLLPLFNDFSTNFTLEVSENGCYKWTTSRLDVIQLIPLDGDLSVGCSTKAMISTISKESTRNTVIVFAEEVSTGQVLRCDVIVDIIVSLKIVTTTRELFMEEAPEQFEVRAYDDQENEFTTLEGVEFHWSIGNWNDHSKTSHGNNVLRFITFRDSPYETPPTIAVFDAIGLRGHIVLLEGIKTGSAKVSVQLPHIEYKTVMPIEVQLIVVANLIIDPPDAYLLKGDTVKYRVVQVQQGRLEEIKFPSQQYYLEIEDRTVALLEETSSMVRGLTLGRTRVVLRDRNVDANESGAVRLPTATLTVAVPMYLTLSLLPHRNWVVLVNQLCTIVVEIFDSDNHKMQIGESVTVVTTIKDTAFEMKEKTRNGTYLTGFAPQPGTASVMSTLESVRSLGGEVVQLKPYISAQADLVVYPRLAVKPAEVVLPWDPYISVKHEAKLKATGGDGTYLWSSVNQSVAIVTQTGLVKAQNQGQTEIVVAMTRNQHNREQAKIYVLPPTHMEIIEYMLEAEVGTPIFIHLALYADKYMFGKRTRVPFTRCQDLPFKLKIWEETNFYYNASAKSTPAGISCATLAVVGRSVGSTKLTVNYEQESVRLEANAIVAAYQPLEVLQPVSGETVLAVGSSRHIVWSGGPRPWLGRNFEHTHAVSSDQSIVDTTEINSSQQGTYVYKVVCRALGEADVTLTVSNKPALSNCKSIESSSTIKVFCSKPRYVSLSIASHGPSCPMNMNSDRVVAHNYRDIKLVLNFKDDQGRNFDNATSILVDWTVSKKSLATISKNGAVLLGEKAENGYILPLEHYQIILPKNHTGLLKVTAVLVGYNNAFLYSLGITPENPPFGITDEFGYVVKPNIQTSIMISLVNDTVITPNRTTIFNHPTNKVGLKVTEGSGQYNLVLSSPEIATVTYVEASRMLEIVPKVDGLLKVALFDLCLPSKPAVVEIQVLRVGSIKVDIVDKIERGHCVTALVHLYDSLDQPLNVLDAQLLELRPHVESEIISVKPTAENQDKREIKFTVTGLQLGETKLTFISGRGVREIQSSPVSVQVFPPLRLYPRNVTITVGTIFQLNYVGGPQPDSNMEFFSMDATIAKVSGFGLIEGNRFGAISVTGMAVGLSKMTGNRIVYSKDTIDVRVIPLEGVKVQSPLSRFKVGSKMPVWAVGIPDQLTPLVLGSIQPPLLFKWQVSAPDIVELRDVFFTTGIELPDRDKVSMRVTALKPGRATLYLNVTLRGSITKCPEKVLVTLTNFVELEVFEELALVKPDVGPSAYKPLLLAPNTEFQLQTNRDGMNQITYTVLSFPSTGSGSGGPTGTVTALSKKGPLLTVDKNGLIATQSSSGRALVLIQSTEDYGIEQTIGVNIEVKPVHYLMMNVKAKLHVDPEKQISALPRGLDLDIVISYHDNTGSEFGATRTDIKMRTNRLDKMHLTRGNVNGTISASLVGSGSTVLKVWDEAIPYHSKDYIKFSVEHLIYPDKNSLTVGDVVCFSMPLLSAKGEPGTWSCADPEILVMERSEGVARATGKTGSALVTYRLSNAVTATTPMQVLPITSITFLPLEGRNISNSEKGKTFLASLVLSSDHAYEKQRNLLAKDNLCHTEDFSVTSFPFSCEVRFNSLMTSVDVHDVFVVRPHFSVRTGVYSCEFEAAGVPSANTCVLQSNITLRAVSGKVVSEPLVIPFLPAVFVHSTEIHLSDKQPSAYLTVSGTPFVLSQIQVTVKETNLLLLGNKEQSSPTTVMYLLKLKPQIWAVINSPEQSLTATLVSSLTSQTLTVPVIVRIKGDTWLQAPCLVAGEGFSSNFPDSIFAFGPKLTIFVSIIVLILAAYYAYYLMLRVPRSSGPPNVYSGGSPHGIIYPQNAFTGSPINSSFVLDRSFSPRQVFSDTEPIYGDPSLSHHSPEVKRRTRRLN